MPDLSKLEGRKTWWYLPAFCRALEVRLKCDDKKWGDTWIERGAKGQENRFFEWIKEESDGWYHRGEPVNWLKIAGEALIGWVRTNGNALQLKPEDIKED